MKLSSEVVKLDQIEYLSSLNNGFIDLAFLDPRYGIGESKKAAKRSGNKKVKQKLGSTVFLKGNNYSEKFWDNSIPGHEYWSNIFRVSKNQLVFGANYFPEIVGTPFKSPRRPEFEDFISRHPKGWIIWDKVNGSNDFNDCELIWTSFDFDSFVIPFLWNGMFQAKSVSEGMVQQGNKSENEKRYHPTMKPLKLIIWLLHRFAKPNWRIGAGTSVIACLHLCLEYSACEIDPEYFEVIQERINLFHQKARQVRIEF